MIKQLLLTFGAVTALYGAVYLFTYVAEWYMIRKERKNNRKRVFFNKNDLED